MSRALGYGGRGSDRGRKSVGCDRTGGVAFARMVGEKTKQTPDLCITVPLVDFAANGIVMGG